MSGRGGVLGLGVGLVLLCATASAQQHWTSAERDRVFAKLPNWTGLWESQISALSDNLTGYPPAAARAKKSRAELIAEYEPLAGPPPYKPEWERAEKARSKSTAAGAADASSAIGKLCRDVPFPALLERPFMFQVFVTPEETLFLYENGDVRHIYTDGREHPKKEDLWPTKRGNSIGHWEGATLVIDTIEIQPGHILSSPQSANLTAEAHFTERVRMVDPNTLEDDLTIDDPERLAHPWHVATRWSRVLDQDRMLPYDCEDDRNPVVNGKLTIAAPR